MKVVVVVVVVNLVANEAVANEVVVDSFVVVVVCDDTVKSSVLSFVLFSSVECAVGRDKKNGGIDKKGEIDRE